MNGVVPTDATVTSGAYPGAREMFIYVKKAHLDAIPGLKEFLAAWTESFNPDGLLTRIGMVAASDEVRERSREAALNHTTMTGEGLH